MSLNLPQKAQPNSLSKLPYLCNDVTIVTTNTITYHCYGSVKHPNKERSVISKETMVTATGEVTAIEYMIGSTGSQFDFSCSWAGRIAGTYALPNTEV